MALGSIKLSKSLSINQGHNISHSAGLNGINLKAAILCVTDIYDKKHHAHWCVKN